MKRILTSIVLASIAFSSMFYGGIALWILTTVLALFCTHELFQMLAKKGIPTLPWLGYSVILLSLVSLQIPDALTVWNSFPVRLLVLGLIFFYCIEVSQKKFYVTQSALFNTGRSILLISGTVPFIYLLRLGKSGILIITLCALVIWAVDIMALVIGRQFGKHQLNTLSPKKTIEGAFGGTLAGLIIAIGVAITTHYSIFSFIGLAALITFLAQIGDLHESLVKRFCGVKDSSQLLPGHGGVYDRLDSTLFVAPILFFLFN